jgi:hypothetical protein
MSKATTNLVKTREDVPQKLRFFPNAGFAIRSNPPILMRWPWVGLPVPLVLSVQPAPLPPKPSAPASGSWGRMFSGAVSLTVPGVLT